MFLMRPRGTLARSVATALSLAAGAALGVTVSQPASAQELPPGNAICVSAVHPKLAARLARGITGALRGRRSLVGLTVADASAELACKVDQSGHFDAASAIKVTIISALVQKVGGQARLSSAQRSLAWAMITESDNNAATKLWNEVGFSGMQRFLDRAKMTHTQLNRAWGLSGITAHDELTLLRLLTSAGQVLTTASRRYVLWLMAHVVPNQRWGVPAGAPAGATVHVKNGWLPYPTGSNWHINSIGAFTGHLISYQIVVLTSRNPSMAYGIDTIQAAARVINRDLAGQ